MISEVNSPDSLIKIFEGLSTDDKPVEGVRNGSEFHEMDTSKTYMRSSETSEWIEQESSGGGIPPGYIKPEGTKLISITANGTTTEDVVDYADAEITVNTLPENLLPDDIVVFTQV